MGVGGGGGGGEVEFSNLSIFRRMHVQEKSVRTSLALM